MFISCHTSRFGGQGGDGSSGPVVLVTTSIISPSGLPLVNTSVVREQRVIRQRCHWTAQVILQRKLRLVWRSTFFSCVDLSHNLYRTAADRYGFNAQSTVPVI